MAKSSEKIVAVLWRDAKICSYRAGEKVYPVRNVSIGALVGSNRKLITLANNLDFEWFRQAMGKNVRRLRKHDTRRSELIRYLVIPKGMVETVVPIGTLSPRQFPAT